MWKSDRRTRDERRAVVPPAKEVLALSLWKLLLISMVIMLAFLAPVSRARSGDIQQDPFYPTGKGSPAASADEWGRDPFGNPFATERHEGGPRSGAQEKLLTGIIYGKNAGIAIIGGEALREGDMVGDRKLVQIRRNSVVLMDKSGRREELFLENYAMGK